MSDYYVDPEKGFQSTKNLNFHDLYEHEKSQYIREHFDNLPSNLTDLGTSIEELTQEDLDKLTGGFGMFPPPSRAAQKVGQSTNYVRGRFFGILLISLCILACIIVGILMVLA